MPRNNDSGGDDGNNDWPGGVGEFDSGRGTDYESLLWEQHDPNGAGSPDERSRFRWSDARGLHPMTDTRAHDEVDTSGNTVGSEAPAQGASNWTNQSHARADTSRNTSHPPDSASNRLKCIDCQGFPKGYNGWQARCRTCHFEFCSVQGRWEKGNGTCKDCRCLKSTHDKRCARCRDAKELRIVAYHAAEASWQAQRNALGAYYATNGAGHNPGYNPDSDESPVGQAQADSSRNTSHSRYLVTDRLACMDCKRSPGANYDGFQVRCNTCHSTFCKNNGEWWPGQGTCKTCRASISRARRRCDPCAAEKQHRIHAFNAAQREQHGSAQGNRVDQSPVGQSPVDQWPTAVSQWRTAVSQVCSGRTAVGPGNPVDQSPVDQRPLQVFFDYWTAHQDRPLLHISKSYVINQLINDD
jgi:hypothetical protein